MINNIRKLIYKKIITVGRIVNRKYKKVPRVFNANPLSLNSFIHMKDSYSSSLIGIKTNNKDINAFMSNFTQLSRFLYPSKGREEFVLIIGEQHIKNGEQGEEVDLYSLVSKEYPEVKIYHICNKSIENEVICMEKDVSVFSMETNPLEYIADAKAIYTYDSDYGFDALIHGKVVHVFSDTFYVDCEGVNYRGQRNVKIKKDPHEIFLRTFGKCKYRSPLTNEPISINEFFVWSVLFSFYDFESFYDSDSSVVFNEKFNFELIENSCFFSSIKECLNSESTLSSKIILGIINGDEISRNDIYEYIERLNGKRLAKYCFSIDNYYRNKVDFDSLYLFLDEFIDVFSSRNESVNIFEFRRVVHSLNYSILRSRGRKLKNKLVFNFDINNYQHEDVWFLIFKHYALTFEYNALWDMLKSSESNSYNFWSKLVHIIHGTEGNNAFRVDSNWYERQRLLEYIGDRVLSIPEVSGSNLRYCIKCFIVKDIDSFRNALHELKITESDIEEFRKLKDIIYFSFNFNVSEYLIDIFDKHRELLDNERFEWVYFKSILKFKGLDVAGEYLNDNGYLNVKNLLGRKYEGDAFYALSTYYRSIGDFSNAKLILSEYKNNIVNNRKNISNFAWNKLNLNIKNLDFLNSTKRILKNNTDKIPLNGYRGLILQAQCVDHEHSLALSAPMVYELKKMGYAILSLSMEANVCGETGVECFDKYIGYLNFNCSDGEVKLNWNIDWENKVVECEGINFYQGIYEHLSIRFRAFDIDINNPGISRFFDLTLKQCDLALRLCLELKRDDTLKNIPVTFLSSASHRAPASIFRDFSVHNHERPIFKTFYNIGYEKYYGGKSTKVSSVITVLDVTKHHPCRAGFLAIPERFEYWMRDEKNILQSRDKANEFLKMNRGSDIKDLKYNSLPAIEQAKLSGKRIICCFGKLTCDLGVPFDGGPAHADMKDWINHSIDVVKGKDDILLLIKPHPVELVSESALDLQQYFRDLIINDLPDNVLYLGHDEFTTSELAPYLDLGILYNGTSSMELTILGVPIMMTSYYGKIDYPLDLIYPESREQYKQYILEGDFRKPSDKLKERAAALLYYMGTNDVSLKQDIIKRSSSNDYIGPPVYNIKRLDDYLKNGDNDILTSAIRAVESSEEFLSKISS
ncbi:hypothetical protein [Vibrio sp. CK2-1]|uniref:hypothetical protein n=1 Tax=Vibrio sp. CK2-1 TaxID=2912249 RepID=UPI001F18459F|nr:hypothetical protein [Vibrio sp. CK2-1]MCF7355631.1 hypothetical protein [Vibrio sp. CK2-1]